MSKVSEETPITVTPVTRLSRRSLLHGLCGAVLVTAASPVLALTSSPAGKAFKARASGQVELAPRRVGYRKAERHGSKGLSGKKQRTLSNG